MRITARGRRAVGSQEFRKFLFPQLHDLDSMRAWRRTLCEMIARVLCSSGDMDHLPKFPPHEITPFINRYKPYIENIYKQTLLAALHDWNAAHPGRKLTGNWLNRKRNLRSDGESAQITGESEIQRTSTAHPLASKDAPHAITHGLASEIQQPEASPPCEREVPAT